MKSKSCGIIFFFFFLLSLAGFSFAQETDVQGIAAENVQEGSSNPADTPGEPKVEAPKNLKIELPPELKNIEREINTSSLTELAAWCRSLGLSEGGDVNSLRNSLRAHFKLPAPSGEEADKKKKIITIDSARSTEYFKIEAVNEEYARLTGDVKVSLKDGDATHNISAWDILFNRTRNIITASGGVVYVKEEGGKKEIFKGESITVNIDNWSSVFLGGISEHSQQGDNKTAYRFSGTVISRNDEEVTILSKASISSASNEESLWSLNASRVWLLPGSDFAMLNALLKVGEIPVLYIPFFYFPADEIVFHPVLGSRSRDGSFVQTTTYLLGKREATKPTEEGSLTSIMGNSDDMEKKWEGFFLRSTGKPDQKKNDTKLKLIVDYYTNLGWYWGTDLTTPKFGILNPINFSAALGYSRILVPVDSSHSPFAPNYDGSVDWNLRHRLNFASSIGGKYGSFSWNIPY
jgi:lipopolysaccharide assembly outer membrane protein LptD (OstA)